jgi:nucleolar protein 53
MSAQVVKKTQPSRKGKKAWRKNVDISDVTEGQEELRAVERLM